MIIHPKAKQIVAWAANFACSPIYCVFCLVRDLVPMVNGLSAAASVYEAMQTTTFQIGLCFLLSDLLLLAVGKLRGKYFPQNSTTPSTIHQCAAA
jgi:hypothetical protein